MILRNALVLNDDFRFQKADLKFGATIEEIGDIREADQEEMDLQGLRVIPGLVDIHTHAAMGVSAGCAAEDYKTWRDFLLKNGVTTFFPTTVTGSFADICSWLQELRDNSQVEGVNLEGPYLNPERRGAHVKSLIRPLEKEELQAFQEAAGGKIKLTTIAPEYGENLKYIPWVKEMGITVSLGHSSADYDNAKEAIRLGADHVTHLFNAMNPLHHRQPGLLGAAVEDDRVFCEVICDGIHVHNAVLKMIYRALGSERMVIISDSMEATGLSDGCYTLGPNQVIVTDGIARTKDGAIAGSTYTLSMMVRNLLSIGISMEEAVKMASLTPARSVHIQDRKGSIAPGKDADLVVVDEDFRIVHTFVRGALI